MNKGLTSSAEKSHRMEPPRYFIVGARPVAIVPTAEGGLDCLALDWQSGGMTRNLTYVSRCIGPHPDVEVDEVDEAAFRAALAEHQPPSVVPWGGPPTGPAVARWEWRDWLQHFLLTRQEPEWAQRIPVAALPEWTWDRSTDRRSKADTPVPCGYLGTSYVEAFATVRWQHGILHLTVQDSKTGAGDSTQDLALPDDWLTAFLSRPWPVTGAQPWF
jgi:hypothetical protein